VEEGRGEVLQSNISKIIRGVGSGLFCWHNHYYCGKEEIGSGLTIKHFQNHNGSRS
jgi:hypothetical protein